MFGWALRLGGGWGRPPTPSGPLVDDCLNQSPWKTQVAGQKVDLYSEFTREVVQESVCVDLASVVGVESVPKARPVLFQEGALSRQVVLVHGDTPGILSRERLGRQKDCQTQEKDEPP